MIKGQIYGTVGAILVAGTMFRGFQTTPAPEDNKKTEIRNTIERRISEEGPWIASCRYWAVVREDTQTRTGPSPVVGIKVDANGAKITSEASDSKDDDSKTDCENSKYGWSIPSVQNTGSVIKPEIHAIIAAVPDPLHSHLALEFDRAVDSLTLAAADHRFLASNYWLPWRRPTTSNSSGESSTSEQANERTRQQQPGLIILKFSPPTPETNAGQTSFYRVVYLFLVGESPATGMDGTQLRNALHYEAYLRDKYDAKLTMADPARITVAIRNLVPKESAFRKDAEQTSKDVAPILDKPKLSLGDVTEVKRQIANLTMKFPLELQKQQEPAIRRLTSDIETFKNDLDSVAFIGPRSSGSATSMRQALLCAPFQSPPAAFVGAGTTSTKIAAAELNERSPWQFGNRACPASKTTSTQTQASATIDSGAKPARIFYLSFGEDTGYEEKTLTASFGSEQAPTAILAEDSTVFGDARAASSTTQNSSKDPLFIRFPREISLLRNAQTEQKGSSSSQTPSPYLNLSLKDPGTDDMIPKFSAGQTPLSQEAQLMAIERQLQKAHIRHILITASNILDEIFLARELHRACPNATIVFYNGGDLLVERDVDNAPYVGSLTVTPYSLVSLDRPSSLSRRAFSDSQAAAIYNAASYIFWWGSADSGNPPRLTGSFSDPKDRAQRFPLHVDAVGADGYYPLGILSPCASDSDQITPALDLRIPSICNFASRTGPTILLPDIPSIPSPFWFLLCGLIFLLCCIHGGVMLSANYWSPFTRDLAISYNDQPRRRAVYIHIGASMLCCSALVLAVPYFAFAHAYRGDRFALAISILVLVAAFFAAAATLTRTRSYLKPLKGSVPSYPTHLYLFFNVLAVAIIPIVAGMMSWVCLRNTASWGKSYVGLYFSYRCLHPTSGVSPLIPLILLLLAWYLWSVFQTARLRFSDMNRPRLPGFIDGDSRPYFVSDETLDNCTPPLASCLIENIECFLITRELARRFTGWSSVWLTGVLGVAYVWLFFLCAFELHIHSFESFLHPGSGLTGFEWLTAILFFPLIMIALSAWLRVLFIWSALQDGLLEPLERTPLRIAFNRLSGVDWVTMLSQSGLNIRWRDMARSIESLRQLMNNQDFIDAVGPDKLAPRRETYQRLDTLIINLRRHIALESMNLESKKRLVEKTKTDLELKGKSEGKEKEFAQIEKQEREVAAQVEEKDALSLEAACYSDTTISRLNSDIPGKETVVDLCYIHGIELSYAEMGKLLLEDPLLPYWKTKRTGYIDSIESTAAKAGLDSKPSQTEGPLYVRLAEEFLVIRYVAFIRTVLVNIRQLMLFVSSAFVFAIVAWNSYPFQPHQQIDWCFTILMIFLTIGFISVFAQMHRNPILSRITSTKPNELGTDFYIRLLTFGAVPVLTWLAYQFPSLGGTIFRILQPSLQVK